MRFLVAALASVILAQPAEARTWLVERDGSGDFSIIQDAVDAAASGDTIRIGPGRFDEGRIVQVPGWTDLVRVLVNVEELTLIGAGGDRTIIGQEREWDLSQGGQRGIQTAVRWGTRRVVVDGIRFENMTYAINDDDIAELYIRNCSFSGNFYSVLDSDGILEIEDSRFEDVRRDGLHLATWSQSRLFVARCSFDHLPDGHWVPASVSVAGVASAEFANCDFRGGGSAFNGVSGTRAIFRHCLFDGQTTFGVVSALGSSLLVEDCTLVNQGLAFRLSANWDLLRTTVADVRVGTLKINGPGNGTAHDCIFAKGSRGVVMDPALWEKRMNSAINYDMRNNWWGTDNPDSIRSWIFDHNDDPDCGYVIDWQPYTGQPVSAEQKSLSGLKSLYW